MRKTAFLFFAVIIHGPLLFAQKHNAQWMFGNLATVMDFRDSVVDYDSTLYITSFFLGVSSICDTDGTMLLGTNGIHIVNANGAIVTNGDSLNPSSYTTSQSIVGLPISQSALFLPHPGNDSLYYLFHYTYDTLGDVRPGRIYCSLIRNNGNGNMEVLYKNRIILSDAVFSGSRMTACKHGNGRDYWLVVQAFDTNWFYKVLITPDTVMLNDVQSVGPTFNNGYINYDGQCKFSPDGTLFATVSIEQEILVMDFDRCSGLFSNPRTRWNNSSIGPPNQSQTGGIGLEFSPDSRYLYSTIVTTDYFIHLCQYEVSILNNPGDSVVVSYIDTTGNNESAWNRAPELAYNGKIYAGCFAPLFKFLHVVHQPNEKGLSCNYEYLSQPTFSLSTKQPPNTINYRLGAKMGSGCDTVPNGIAAPVVVEAGLRLAPNPATDWLRIDAREYLKNANLTITDATGRIVYNDVHFYLQRDVDVSQWSNGVYVVTVSNPQKKLVGRLVKQ